MDQQPLVGEDVGDGAADPAQHRVGIAEMAGQHGEARARACRLVQHQPVVAADLGPAAAAIFQQPTLPRHPDVIVVEAHPRQRGQRRGRGSLHREVARGIDRVGGASQLARHDAAHLRHLFADQEIGLAARQVGQRVARDHLEFDLPQLAPELAGIARDQRRGRLLRRQAHRAAHRVAEARAATVDGLRRLLHRLGVGQQFLARAGRHEAVGQAIEQAGADLLLERADAPRHGRMADAQRLGRRRQRAFAGEGEKDAEVVPVGVRIHVQICTMIFRICGLTNASVHPTVALGKARNWV